MIVHSHTSCETLSNLSGMRTISLRSAPGPGAPQLAPQLGVKDLGPIHLIENAVFAPLMHLPAVSLNPWLTPSTYTAKNISRQNVPTRQIPA